MNLRITKATLITLWIVAAGALAASGHDTSVSEAMLFLVVGFVPPVVILALWNPPTQTLSESIREARR